MCDPWSHLWAGSHQPVSSLPASLVTRLSLVFLDLDGRALSHAG